MTSFFDVIASEVSDAVETDVDFSTFDSDCFSEFETCFSSECLYFDVLDTEVLVEVEADADNDTESDSDKEVPSASCLDASLSEVTALSLSTILALASTLETEFSIAIDV
ncbi:hypothetical protein [Staphylococcus coagulans]|uniref:hypothetical protein n=1 Tax=Staphylococcus coagulans TaxID=74706 RepID=UPI001FD8F585|nr:hypothetical protein [Staphylococcus coagulans]